MVEIRVDLIKLVYFSQRGLTSGKKGIGIWSQIMYTILVFAILANFGMLLIELY